MPSAHRVELPANFTIQRVAAMHRELQAPIENHQDIDICAHAVERVDTAALQLILALRQASLRQSSSVGWISPSPILIEAAEQLGLRSCLGLHQTISAET